MSRALAIAQRQYGAITRAQALEAGVHRRAIDRLVASGRWETVARGVYRIVGSARSWEQRALALILAAGDEAVGSHRTAICAYGVEGFAPPGRIDITTPRHHRKRILGTTVHETLDPHLLDRRMRRGIPVTGPARTLLDLCAVVDDDLTALGALDDMLRRRLVTWPELWECLVLHARRGRNGVARFRRILVKRWGKRGPRGVFARTVLALLTDAGLPEPVAEHPVKIGDANYRLDLAYPELLIGIELDDKESHLTDKAFEEDPIRENRLKLAGWLVLRYTWDRLVDEPQVIVAEVRAALLARSCAA
jgi:hypothetical protein